MKRVVVTGANGHIGANVVRALLERRGVEVVAFVRPGSDRRGIEGLPIEIAEGDILRPDTLAEAMRGADTLIHCAAQFALWAKDADAILRPAIEGTENVLRAAAAAGVRRVVVTSSVATVGGSTSADVLLDAEHWAEGLTVPYYVAKQRAERRAWELAEELGLAMCTILPTMVLGPHDHRITPSTKVILDMLKGDGATVDGGGNLVDVRDVAEAHVRAAERGVPGERYIVGGENVATREIGALVERVAGVKVKHLTFPRWLFSTVAGVMELGAAITGKPPALTRAVVRDLLGRYAWYDLSKTRAHLGLEPRDAEAVIRATAEWLAPWITPAAEAA